MIILFMPLASFISLQGAFLAVLFVHLAINEYFCRKVTIVMYRGFNLLLEENCFEQDDFKKIQEVGFKSISHQKTIIIEKISIQYCLSFERVPQKASYARDLLSNFFYYNYRNSY